jgi:hypothetical protein
MNYKLATSFADFDRSDTSDYFVRIVDGRVHSYGEKGDFGTTKNPTIDYNINRTCAPKSAASARRKRTTSTRNSGSYSNSGLSTACAVGK